MNEALLQFIWKHQLLDTSTSFITNTYEEIIILKQGTLNNDAGPDFTNAKIKIGNTIWAGNIELHVKNSDWVLHRHDDNKAYKNIILHVVYDYNKDIDLPFPVLELKKYIPIKLIENYKLLNEKAISIPCSSLINKVNTITILQQLEKMLYERMAAKTSTIELLLKKYNNNWQEVFYITTARAFGLHINQDAFEHLAISIPLKIISKHKSNLHQLESLLYGQAGFLENDVEDDYFISLKKEYQYLKTLYKLETIEVHHFKFLRLRPANFPTVRIAQFANLLHTSIHLFSKITEAKSINDLQKLLQVTVSDYWKTHYSFTQKEIKKTERKIGIASIDLMLINAIIPTLYIYGKHQGIEQLCNNAIDFLEEIKPEKNSIIALMNDIGFESKNASDTQAILHLKKNYCDLKRCLECSIGYSILKK
jgi:hypothetical protein